MNREDLIPHPLTSVPDDETQTVTQQKKFLAPQNLLSTPYSNIGISLGGVSASYTLAGNNHSHNSGISLQQIKDMLLQESRKGDLINSKERVSFNHGIISSCTYPSVSDGLNLNLAPSQVLSVHTVSPHQDTDESSDLTSIISMNSANAPRMTPNQEPFQGTTINDSTSLLRGSMSCENSLSELTPTITPVTLMETSSDSLIFEKVVFTPDQTFPKEAPITPVSKDDKEATSNASSIVSNNRLLSKLIQSYKPDTITPLPLPLRISEFTKIPNASLKPSLPAADLNAAGKISSGSSPSVMNSLVSTSSHELPLHNSLTDFSRTSVTNPVTNSLNPLSVMASSSCNTFPTSNHSVSLSSNSHALHHPIHSNQPLEDLPFTDHFQNVNQGRRVQACHEHDLNDPILAKPSSKRTMQTTNSEAPVDKDRFTFPHDVLGKVNSNLVPVLQPETRTEPLLMTGDQLIPENPITSHIDSTHALNFIPDQQILSHISQLHEIPSENVKENRSMRPVDMFLSDLHSTDDHDLLRASLSNTIVPDISSNLVSSNLVSSAIPVSSETTLSTSIGSSSHLPELPPSPILANISPDFLVGGGTSTTKTSPGSQPPFLPSLSTATENLALSFSSHFLDNSNMSIDMGSLSEGDASLNVPSHSFSESFDSSNPKRSSGNELTFTHALKNATEKGNFDQVKSNKVPGSDQSTSPSFTSPLQKGSSQSDNSFKTNSLLTNNPEIFKVPPQMKQLPSTDDASSPPSSISSSTLPSSLSSSLSSLSSCLSTSPSTKRHSFSAKEIPLIKIDSDSPPLPKSSPPKPESLVQQVSCFKCQLCSYLSLDKKDMNDHMKTKHNNALLETTTHNRSSSSSLSAKPTPTTTEESPPQPKKRKKTDPKNATTITKKTKTSKKKQSKKKDTPKTQCKVEMCPREKGGFQRRIVMIGQDEKERETRADSDSKSQIDFNSNEAVKSESDVMMDIKTDISVEDVPIPQQEDKRASFSGNETPLSSAGAEETPTKKTTLKPGRPAASQTMGIIKFKKSHPKVPIPEETLGIRCGVNGCGLRMKEEENILYHRKCHVEAFLKCPECHTKFTHWASLAMHLWRMHMVDMELHKCEKCNFKSYSYTKLMNGHWKTHSTERPFLCDVCGKDFKTAKQLRSHKILHVEKNEELKHHCDMCKRKFAEKRMLLLHLEAVHKKVKPYLCNYCGNSFASKSTLNLHIRKHTGEKPFACESCSYRTSDHNSMRRHKMKHTNDRPYSCPYCDYSSIQSSTFKVHLRRKHEVQAQKDGVIFSCSFCTFKTVKKDNFLAHVGTHHKITEEEQNKEAERQQQQITKQGNKKQGQKQQQHQQLEQQQQLQQQPTKQTEQQQQQQQRVTLTTTTDQQQQRLQQQPVLNQNLQQQHQQQQVVIAKNQVATALTTVAENNQNGAAAILVTNSNSKSEPHSQQQQQPMFYVFGELVPVPHVVNIDVNEAETTDMSTELVNSVLLQGNLQNSISGPVIMGSGEHYAYTNTEGALLQSVNINDGVVQLTPEVVAMPVTTDLPTPLTSQSVPGLIYVATSNEGDSTHCRLVQNSSLFS